MDAKSTLSTPAHLFNARRLCKESTDTALDWLVRNGALKNSKSRKTNDENEKSLTAKEILSNAARISKRRLTAPQYVRSAFQTALVNRRRITAWYREHEVAVTEATDKHEHFNRVLDEAYTTLFREQADSAVEAIEEAAEETENLNRNAFGPLADVPTEEISKLTDAEIQEHLKSWAASNTRVRYTIADDPFEEMFALHRYVLEMDYMADTIKGYWESAAKGDMPIPLAAWLTTAGYYGIQKICNEYQNARGLSLEELTRQYLQKKTRMQITTGEDVAEKEADRSGYNPTYKSFSSRLGLLAPIPVLREWKMDKQMHAGAVKDMPRVKPTDWVVDVDTENLDRLQLELESMSIISKPHEIELPADEAAKLRETIGRHLDRDGKCWDSIIRSSCQIFEEEYHQFNVATRDARSLSHPMLAEIQEFLRADFEDQDTSQRFLDGRINEGNLFEYVKYTPKTELVFGLTLLLETGKSFFWDDGEPNTLNARTRALKLAEEVKYRMNKRVNAEVEAGHNRNLQQDTLVALELTCRELERVCQNTSYDLYYQMPWTAGAQMAEILHMAMDSGLAVCRSRDILAQVLHVYNFVRQVAPKSTRPIAFLEQLCDLFVNEVFMGERPKSRFNTILFRVMGGGVDRDQHTKKFRVGIPTSTNDGAPDSDRLKANDVSLFFDLRAQDPPFHARTPFWTKVFTNGRLKKSSANTKKQELAIERQIRDVPFALTLDRIKELAMRDFEGPFPVAKINFFKVFDLAEKILTAIARRYQADMPSELKGVQNLGMVMPPPADACAGSTFLPVLMTQVDGLMEGKMRNRVDLERHGGVRLVWDAIEECAGREMMENFFWEALQ